MKYFLVFISIIMIIMGCVGGASPAANSGGTSFDTAITEAAGRMETRLIEGTKVALINFSSSSAQLSEYVLEGISLHLVNSGKLVVVDRANLDRIRQEQGFQLSGEVSDESAKVIGQMLGADAIVTGSLIQIGQEYRINLKAISVEAATVVVQYATDIIADERVRTLFASGGGSGGGTQTTTTRTTGSGTSGTAGISGTSGGTGSRAIPTITSVIVSPETISVDKGKTHQFEATISGTNNPDLTVTWSVTGNISRGTSVSEDGILTVADDEIATPLTVIATSTVDRSKNASATVAVPGGINAINVTNVATWNTTINRIRNGGNNQTYIINVIGNVSVPTINEQLFGSVTGLTVTIQGNGTVSISNTTGSLLRIGARQTVIAKDVTLRGRSGNNNAVIEILSGGTFRMEGSALVTGNSNGGGSSYGGGGIRVTGGTFILQDNASVKGNSATLYGGGVYITDKGTFTMVSGTISDNTVNGIGNRGGGVDVYSGTFTMQGGTISGNTSNYEGGGGVAVGSVPFGYGTFTMQGGTISGNTAPAGGGVYVAYSPYGTFTKTGGTVYGYDSGQSLSNTASSGKGHALYEPYNSWRNATAGPDDTTSGFGFFLND